MHRNGIRKPARAAIKDCVSRFGLPPPWGWRDFTWLSAVVITSRRWGYWESEFETFAKGWIGKAIHVSQKTSGIVRYLQRLVEGHCRISWVRLCHCRYRGRCLQTSHLKKSVSSKRTVYQAQSIHPDEPNAGEHIEDAIISGNGVALYCEETVPNAGKNHSTMRHGFAGRGLQYVSRIFFDPVGCTGAYEQFPEREDRP